MNNVVDFRAVDNLKMIDKEKYYHVCILSIYMPFAGWNHLFWCFNIFLSQTVKKEEKVKKIKKKFWDLNSGFEPGTSQVPSQYATN